MTNKGDEIGTNIEVEKLGSCMTFDWKGRVDITWRGTSKIGEKIWDDREDIGRLNGVSKGFGQESVIGLESDNVACFWEKHGKTIGSTVMIVLEENKWGLVLLL